MKDSTRVVLRLLTQVVGSITSVMVVWTPLVIGVCVCFLGFASAYSDGLEADTASLLRFEAKMFEASAKDHVVWPSCLVAQDAGSAKCAAEKREGSISEVSGVISSNLKHLYLKALVMGVLLEVGSLLRKSRLLTRAPEGADFATRQTI